MSTTQDRPAVNDAKAKMNDASAKAQATINNTAEQIKAHPVYQQGTARVNEYMGQLDKELSRYPLMNQFEERTNIRKTHGTLLAVATFLGLIFINSLALPVSNLVGWAFPAYLSFRAIESPGHEDDIQWLTYWTVFGFFTFLESMMLRVVLYYLPWYFPLKTAFVLWLQLPATRGAQTFYHSAVKPVMGNFRQKRQQYTNTGAGSATSSYPTTTSSYQTSTVGDHEKIL